MTHENLFQAAATQRLQEIALVLLSILVVCNDAHAQSLTIRRLASAPHVGDFANADPPEMAAAMTSLQPLIQRSPSDGDPVSERTEVYLGFDTQHLYAVFVCWYTPGAVRAHRVNRDRLPDDDDSVALHLDTFRDQRHLYGFQVNPAGVQVDGVYTEGQGWDLSFDTVWQTDALIRPDRYVVMMTVPFSSIRFPAGADQEWGVFVYRGIPRKNEEAFWPPYSTRLQGRVAYAATLRGISQIDPGHATQFTPYGFLRAVREGAGGAPDATRGSAESRGGLDVKTVARGGLVLDLTANPDFSQVESDEPQTTVNKRFEVYFPEKRPFFMENANVFDTPIQAVFTRRIQDPKLGARLTGRVGSYAVGALVTDDIGVAAPDDSGQSDRRAVDGVFRVSRGLRADSSVGALYVGHREQLVENQAGGVDARWRMTPNWVAAAQVLSSEIRRPQTPLSTGAALRTSVEGSGRTYGYQATFTDITPEFTVVTGFIPRTDIRDLTQVASATFRPAGKWLTSWGPRLTASEVRDHASTVLDRTLNVETQFELSRSSHVSIYRDENPERLRTRDAPSLSIDTLFHQHTTGVAFGSAPLAWLTISGDYSTGLAINLSPSPGHAPQLGDSRQMDLTLSVRPAPALTIDTAAVWSALSNPTGSIFSDRIVRTRWNYQVTRRLSARAIAQLEDLDADRVRSALVARRSHNIDLLLTYLVNPGTAFYIGWNSDRQDLEARQSAQFFLKISYAFHP
jgi:uncharacterized protein DUF5916